MPDNDQSNQTRNTNDSAKENTASFDPNATMPGKRILRERGELQIGDVILNRYELLKKLGSGAMGVVFKCRDQVSQVEYALKMVPPELARDAEAMEDVRDNFQLIHGLKHPNIASADFLERDEYGSYFLVMEYARGESLTQWMKRKWRTGRPELSEVAGIVKQIASALDYAHSQRILHRDIKPANVMVDEAGKVKVLDFGLASKVRSTMTMLSVNQSSTSGTPHYLSPEQFKGRYPTPASDQYALGVLTYQMLSGHLPFEADDSNILRSAVLSDEADPVDDVSDAVNQCLRKVLSKDKTMRYGTCTAFADALNKAMSGVVHDGESALREEKESPQHDLNSERGRQTDEETAAADSSPESIFRKGLADYKAGRSSVAVDSFRKAAERGHAEAQRYLGECYEYGRGMKTDRDKAIGWYRKSAEQGNAEAQYNLGGCYYYGLGVEKDFNEAIRWYRKAAAQGLFEAECRLREIDPSFSSPRGHVNPDGAAESRPGDTDGELSKRRIQILLKQQRWQEAIDGCRKMQDVNPENADLYLLSCMASRKCLKEEELWKPTKGRKIPLKPLSRDRDYQVALEFASPERKKELLLMQKKNRISVVNKYLRFFSILFGIPAVICLVPVVAEIQHRGSLSRALDDSDIWHFFVWSCFLFIPSLLLFFLRRILVCTLKSGRN